MKFNNTFADCFDEPSKAEQIICQAEDDIKQLFSDGIKNVILQAREAEEKLGKLNQEIKDAEYKKAMTEKALKDSEEKVEKAELYSIPKKYIDRFIRNVTKDFVPGDEVWYVASNYTSIPCGTCNGNKKVVARINEIETEVQCPHCNGRGYSNSISYKVEKRKISDIRLRLCFDRETRVRYWNTECIFLSGYDSSIDIKNLFATEEKAAEEAEKRNGRRKVDERNND